MKTTKLILLVLILFCANGLIAEVINVRDYGATGDGSDQTAAIQAAINAASSDLIYIPPTSHNGATAIGTAPIVYFPQGKYALSSSLDLKEKYMCLRGDNAIITLSSNASDPTIPAITYSMPYRNEITGLIFINFETAISLGNTTWNVDQGMVKIADCQFVGTTGYAIKYGQRSSILQIENCRFDKCMYALLSWNCDMVVFDKNWLSKPPLTEDRDSTFLIEGGTVNVSNSIFISQGLNTGEETAWFAFTAQQSNSHHNIYIDHCRFSDENNGTTLVNWHVPGRTSYPAKPVGIVIRDSNLQGGPANISGQDQSIVRLFECPNFLVIKNNFGFLSTRPVVWADGVDGSTKVWTDYVNAPLNVEVSGNCGGGVSSNGYLINYQLPEFDGKASQR